MKHKKDSRLSKLPRPSLPARVRARLPRRKKGEELTAEALSNLPRITNETVAAHREEVLGSARKYIYPLQHSRGRIIKISTALFVVALVAFFVYCGLALYRLQSTSTFIYQVTRVIPFPVARAGSNFVSYENYLFELRHLTHYYEVQLQEDLGGKDRRHYEALKKDSMQKVIDDAYVKQLAKQHNISVSNREVNDQITLVKSQNRLGTNDQMLEDVLNQFWGWSISDFRRELKSQLLAQKVASQLDTATHARASAALVQLKNGKDFAALAAEVSDDAATKAAGGQYGAPITKSNRDVPPQVVDALFKLQPGQTSEIINTGYTLEIIKVAQVSGDKVTGSHISFKLTDIEQYIKPLKEQQKTRRFISV
ncbi:MAG TPA: peptidylprolyl isomerase [Candidatus Saccharimonadales bacterium]|nr:peptidylprolyl isomerase [Candidatus Saccharimonadales bacterium]